MTDYFDRVVRGGKWLLVIAALIWQPELYAQATQSWHVAGGIGLDGPYEGQASLIAEAGRTLYRGGRTTVDVVVGAAVFQAGSRVCAGLGECDVRKLAQMIDARATVRVSLWPSTTSPYLGAGIGAWSGRDEAAEGLQSSVDDGALLSVELGYRLKRVDAGVAIYQFDGSVHEALHLGAVICRIHF